MVGFDSLHLGVAKESRFVRHRMHFFYSFSFPSLTVLKFKVQDFFLVVWSRKGTHGLDLVSIFPWTTGKRKIFDCFDDPTGFSFSYCSYFSFFLPAING